jgi:hypothetical protein
MLPSSTIDDASSSSPIDAAAFGGGASIGARGLDAAAVDAAEAAEAAAVAAAAVAAGLGDARSGDGSALALASPAYFSSGVIAAHICPMAVDTSPNVAFGRDSFSPGRRSFAKSW